MSSPELRVLPQSDTGSRSITELFHRINSVLPDTQLLVTVQGETLASAALELLRQHGYSQLPVLVGTEVIGIFSYRSFSEAVLELCSTKGNPKTLLADLTVEECYESAQFARVTDEFKSWFDALDVQNAVLVGEAHRLQGIVTPMDVLRYLYDVSKPFVLVAEIETSLRALMRMAVSPERLAECALTSLAKQYVADQVPIEFGRYDVSRLRSGHRRRSKLAFIRTDFSGISRTYAGEARGDERAEKRRFPL